MHSYKSRKSHNAHKVLNAHDAHKATPQHIIITGASSGIGAALAVKYAKTCQHLLLIARNQERLLQVQELCNNQNVNCQVICKAIDVTNAEVMREAIDDFAAKYSIDLIIANAGISAGTGAKGKEDQEQIKTIYEINILGTVNSIYPAMAHMQERRFGQIAIMSSASAFMPIPTAPAYVSSKQCVSFLGLALSHYLAPYNVKLSVIYPGFVKTPMTAVNQFPMPLLMDVDKAADLIIKGLSQGQSRIIFPRLIYYLTLLMNLMPNFIKRRIFGLVPAKPNLEGLPLI